MAMIGSLQLILYLCKILIGKYLILYLWKCPISREIAKFYTKKLQIWLQILPVISLIRVDHMFRKKRQKYRTIFTYEMMDPWEVQQPASS